MYITSKKGRDFIKSWEALRLKSYQDVAGYWTVGWGHITTAQPNQTITVEKAEELFQMDLERAETDVRLYVTDYVTISQGMFDALVSLVFNLGGYNIFLKKYQNGYPQGSSLYNKILDGNFTGASDHFTDFVKAGGVFVQGLHNRRVQEQKMFLEGFKKKSLINL